MLPSNYGGGSREKIQRIIELASAAPQKMISNATFFNENWSTIHMPLFNAIDENASATPWARSTENLKKPQGEKGRTF